MDTSTSADGTLVPCLRVHSIDRLTAPRARLSARCAHITSPPSHADALAVFGDGRHRSVAHMRRGPSTLTHCLIQRQRNRRCRNLPAPVPACGHDASLKGFSDDEHTRHAYCSEAQGNESRSARLAVGGTAAALCAWSTPGRIGAWRIICPRRHAGVPRLAIVRVSSRWENPQG